MAGARQEPVKRFVHSLDLKSSLATVVWGALKAALSRNGGGKAIAGRSPGKGNNGMKAADGWEGDLLPSVIVPRVPSLIQELAAMGVVEPELAGEAYRRKSGSYWRPQQALERYLAFLHI
ncbi:MAG: hypothetical protein ABWW70_06200 [Thermoproteota archaeon]